MNLRSLVSVSLVSLTILATFGVLAWQPAESQAHCQVPCGIYDDAARIRYMKEDAATIAKCIDNINHLAEAHSGNDFNQAVRWVTTKDDHASHIIEVVAVYFLTQKVKPVGPDAEGYDLYLKTLADHHAVMVAAMKTKQSADPETVTALNKAIDKLTTHYE